MYNINKVIRATDPSHTLTFVGIDPGTTSAVAIINLKGNIVAIKSKRGFSISEISEFILDNGKPLVIATDVSKVPSLVRRVAATFNAQVYHPHEDLTAREKKEVSMKYRLKNRGSRKLKDDHSADALTAAYQAHLEYRELIEEVRKQLKSRKKERYFTQVLEIMLKKPTSVENILERIKSAEKKRIEVKNDITVAKKVGRVKKPGTQKLAKLALKNARHKIKNLEDYIKTLKRRIRELEGELKSEREMRMKSRRIKKPVSKRIEEKKKAIAALKKDMDEVILENIELTSIIEKIYKGWRIIPVITEEELPTCSKSIVYLKTEKISEKNISPHIQVIISKKMVRGLSRRDIPNILEDQIKIIRHKNIVIIRPHSVENVLKKINFEDWLEGYKRRHE